MDSPACKYPFKERTRHHCGKHHKHIIIYTSNLSSDKMAKRSPKNIVKGKNASNWWWQTSWIGVALVVSLVLGSIILDSSGDDRAPVQQQQPPPPTNRIPKKLPAEIHPDHVARFYSNRDLDQLHYGARTIFDRSVRNPQNEHLEPSRRQHKLGSGTTYTSAYKMQEDLEQAEYLATHLEDKQKAAYFQNVVAPTYRRVLDRMPSQAQLNVESNGFYYFKQEDYDDGIKLVYNKALHVTDFDTLRDSEGNAIPLLSTSMDSAKIEREWFGEDPQHQQEGIVVLDDVLSPQALQKVRQLLLESTVWYQTRRAKSGRYTGAYLSDGLHDRILMEMALELSDRLPRIFEGHPLNFLWAYKYDPDYATGINIHADEAAVNVNCWLTPNEANLDPTSGGLVVYTAKPPADWNYQHYNGNPNFIKENLLKHTNYANVTVPHRQNRCVLFDSALFHNTDKLDFKKGYENRRINLTFLYGQMQKAAKAEL